MAKSLKKIKIHFRNGGIDVLYVKKYQSTKIGFKVELSAGKSRFFPKKEVEKVELER